VKAEVSESNVKEFAGFVPLGYGPMVGVGEIEFGDPIEQRELGW
jgi:hypothetical protein